MIIAKDKAAAHVIAKGGDSKEMGRWSWITVKGKRNKKTTIVTTYRARNTQQTALRQLGVIRKFHVSKQPEESWEDDLNNLIAKKRKRAA